MQRKLDSKGEGPMHRSMVSANEAKKAQFR
jgi:hypothetical protein